MVNRRELIALTSIALLSVGASKAYGAATAHPPQAGGGSASVAEMERLFRQLSDAISSDKTLTLDVQKEFSDYVRSVNRSVSPPPPPPTPDSQKILLDLQKSLAKKDQMFDMLRQIIDKYNQTCKGVIESIGR